MSIDFIYGFVRGYLEMEKIMIFKNIKKINSFLFRVFIATTGTALIGFGVHLTLIASTGMEPFTTLVDGVNHHLNLTFGEVNQIINIFFLVISFLLDKKNIGIATVMLGLGCGYFIDLFNNLQIVLFTEIPPLVNVVLGVFIYGFGIAVYLTAKLGAGPVEGIMLFFTKFLKLELHYVRIIMDVIFVIVGISLGAIWGYGTLIAAFCTGPSITIGLKVIQLFHNPQHNTNPRLID